MTLREYILRWQEACDKNKSRPATYAAHGYLFKNHILPGLWIVECPSGIVCDQAIMRRLVQTLLK